MNVSTVDTYHWFLKADAGTWFQWTTRGRRLLEGRSETTAPANTLLFRASRAWPHARTQDGGAQDGLDERQSAVVGLLRDMHDLVPQAVLVED